MALSPKLLSAIQKLAKNLETNPGGLADGMSPEDFPQDQLAKGTKVESKEHGSERGVVTTMDHLVENDQYYDYLEEMEKQMEKDKGLKKAACFQKLASVLIRKAESSEEIQKWIDKYSVKDPSAAAYENGHIYVLFSDGELDITKAGSLFGQRNLNMQRRPSKNKAPEGLKWPSSLGPHSCVFIEDGDVADALQSAIFEPPAVGSVEYNREEALGKFFRERKPVVKEVTAQDVAIATGFVPQDINGSVFIKDDIKLNFQYGHLKAVETKGKHYDFHWYGRFNKNGIWLHPKGWWFEHDPYYTPEERKTGTHTITPQEKLDIQKLEDWKKETGAIVGSNSNFVCSAPDEEFIKFGFKKL